MPTVLPACSNNMPGSRAAFGPMLSFVIAADGVIPVPLVMLEDCVIPAGSVIPAQAGIHVGAGCRWRSRTTSVRASCQAALGAGDRHSALVAAKARAPRPQRFTGAVGAAPDCPAMLGLAAASRNSLHSLRSLRSNSRDESVDESRCARGRSPGTNSPPDCLCPGLAFSAHQRRAATWAHAPLRGRCWHAGVRGPEDRTPKAQRRARRYPL